jgi:D-amino peptidase
MRLYVSADIEGLGGVTSRDHLRPGGFEYEAARDWMTDAVLAVCETARDAGVSEVVISDSHGNGQNIRWEKMPGYAQLVRSWPRPLGMMQGIEVGDYAGAVLLGYHAGSGNPGGVMSHTLSSELFQEVRLNGAPASEAVISAAIAGHHGVPVVMFAGDDVAVEEAARDLPAVPGVVLKHACGTYSARHLSPQETDARLRIAVGEALAAIAAAEPFRLAEPVSCEIRLRTRLVAEWLAYLPDVERLDAFTIRYPARDVLDLSRFLMFVVMARTALA